MLNQTIGADEGNHGYQRQLARSLVASLGFDEALRICRENHWDGILNLLDNELPAIGA